MKQGLLLKMKRIEKGYNQESFGAAIGVSRQTVSFYERGKIIPKPDKIKKISKLLDTSVDELFFQD